MPSRPLTWCITRRHDVKNVVNLVLVTAEDWRVNLSVCTLQYFQITHFKMFCGLQVKEALAVLIIQNMVAFRVNDKAGSTTEYSCIIDNAASRIRFEKYTLCVKKRHGDIAELIMNELLLHGQMSRNEMVDAVIEKHGAQGVWSISSVYLSVKHFVIVVLLLPLIKIHLCGCARID